MASRPPADDMSKGYITLSHGTLLVASIMLSLIRTTCELSANEKSFVEKLQFSLKIKFGRTCYWYQSLRGRRYGRPRLFQKLLRFKHWAFALHLLFPAFSILEISRF